MSLDTGFHRLYFAAVSIFVSRYELASPTLTGHNVENTQDYGYTQYCSAGGGVFVHTKHPRYATAIPMPSLALITELH